MVLTGQDFRISHYGGSPMDNPAVEERTVLEALRGLVAAQMTVLDDLLDEFVLYLMDPRASDVFEVRVLGARMTMGRVELLEPLLEDCGLKTTAGDLLSRLRTVVERLNVLAHSPIFVRE